MSIDRYEELLYEAVDEMREPNTAEKLAGINEEYSTLLKELETSEARVPEEVHIELTAY